MNKTAITSSVPPAGPVFNVTPISTRTIRKKHPLYEILSVVASLRVTVVLFVFSLALVFFGTLALKDEGLNTVLEKYFRNYGIVWLPMQIFARFAQVFFSLPPDTNLPNFFPFPGGWLLGGLLLVNLLAAHAVRFRFTWKRSGVLLIHAGIVVMMLGELITGTLAHEGRMTLPKGHSSNYVEDHNLTELAIVHRVSAAKDKVVVVPGSLLRQEDGTEISDDTLPFDITIVHFMPNSDTPGKDQGQRGGRKGQHQPTYKANAGDGRKFIAKEKKAVGGTGSDTDIPAAYLRFTNKKTGKSLGTYLVSVWWSGYWISGLLERPQTVTVDGVKYEVSFRFKRTYKDYTIHLLEFHHDVYVGTEVPKNFSSRIRLLDGREDRDVVISMNNPMRYAGETFYQSGFLPGDRGTILQVVENPGSFMPYLACGMVAVGMLVHFLLHLAGFLGRIRLGQSAAPEEQNLLSRAFPWLVVGAVATFLVWKGMPPHEPADEMHTYSLGEVPVADHGRVKPFDTVARTGLTIISNRPYFVDEDDKRQPAIKWLADVMTSDHNFQERKVFHITNPGLQQFFKLGAGDTKFSLADLRAGFPKLIDLLDRIPELEEGALEGPQAEMLNLLKDVRQYIAFGRFTTPYKIFRIENDEVLDLVGLKARHGLRYSYPEFVDKIPKLLKVADGLREDIKAGKLNENALSLYQAKVLELIRHLELYLGLARLQADTLRVVPRSLDGEDWMTYPQALRAETLSPAAQSLRNILDAYGQNDVARFNRELTGYRELLGEHMPDKVTKTRFETFFNRFDPFFYAKWLYVGVFLLACSGWLGWTRPLNRAAFWLAVVTLAVHSAALFARMYLMGRAFVFITNLYSSAVFISCACVIVGLFIESIYRNGIGCALAGILGYLPLEIADFLGQSGDTLQMMEAVLDTSFWLSTHVTAVAIGYVATFFAGFLGIIYIASMVSSVVLRYLDGDRSPGVVLVTFTAGLPLLACAGLAVGISTIVGAAADSSTPSAREQIKELFLKISLSDGVSKVLAQMIYGVVCFAMLFSFTGTVLGGIWADQSWGRFWGWDPKENGALLIVLWNALILHARWAGIVKQRGMAVLTVGGNMVTGWSWFGTNQLGVGLHAYGFNNTLATGLVIFWSTQVLLILIGLMPRGWWKPMPMVEVVGASPRRQ